MRRLVLIGIGVVSLALTVACNYGFPNSQPPSNISEGPPSPELMQYAEDMTRGWETRLVSTSWRSEIDDERNGRPVHIVSEASCPDRLHVTTSGAETFEKYYIGKTMYLRNGNGRWQKSSLPMPYVGLGGCRIAPKKEDLDPVHIRLVAEQLKDIELSKPVMREFGGRKCREWTRTFAVAKGSYSNSNCYDVKTHELVHSVTGKASTTYYWNVPVDIKPPV